jgi:hypothetical protein
MAPVGMSSLRRRHPIGYRLRMTTFAVGMRESGDDGREKISLDGAFLTTID